MKSCKFNCSGCSAYLVISFSLLDRLYLWLKIAKCYRCFHYNRELEICSELSQCGICKCEHYTKRNNRCMKFKKSNW